MRVRGQTKRLKTGEITLEWFAEANAIGKRILSNKSFFFRTCECLTDEDSSYRPSDGMLTVSGQILHVTMGITLFLYGLFDRDEVSEGGAFLADLSAGESMFFKRGITHADWMNVANSELRGFNISESLAAFSNNMDLMRRLYCQLGPSELAVRMPPGGMFPDYFTRVDALEMLLDHNTHHRGGLAQYARLLEREPKIPYMEISERATEQELLAY